MSGRRSFDAGRYRERLGALSAPDDLALFTAIAGADRVAAEPDAVRRVLALCGGYPLGIRLCAHRVRSRPRWSVAAIADQLTAEMSDPYGAAHHDCVVATARIARAYAELDPLPARLLRLIGVLPSREVSAPDVTGLLGVPAHRAAFALEALADVSLLVEAGGGDRYRTANPLVWSLAKRAAYAVDGADAIAALSGSAA
ncbi:hypothetical protein [Catenuloplanes indicus]|uniref:Uncharacterized protein n=1 Tax=Catenuloplanes indicus TaxID=137267 RepID=A0AAE4B0Y8_9ACTN|nr:hypothetical protein [Catenuloplanes indicus]MDQ0370052.1 hypothetical protein [Catenuloplanes indicus]